MQWSGAAQSSLAALPSPSRTLSAATTAAGGPEALIPPNDGAKSGSRLVAVYSAPHCDAELLGWLPATVREVVECELVGEWVRHERGWSRWRWPMSSGRQRSSKQPTDEPTLLPHEVPALSSQHGARQCYSDLTLSIDVFSHSLGCLLSALCRIDQSVSRPLFCSGSVSRTWRVCRPQLAHTHRTKRSTVGAEQPKDDSDSDSDSDESSELSVSAAPGPASSDYRVNSASRSLSLSLPVGSCVAELDCLGAFIRHERGSATQCSTAQQHSWGHQPTTAQPRRTAHTAEITHPCSLGPCPRCAVLCCAVCSLYGWAGGARM